MIFDSVSPAPHWRLCSVPFKAIAPPPSEIVKLICKIVAHRNVILHRKLWFTYTAARTSVSGFSEEGKEVSCEHLQSNWRPVLRWTAWLQSVCSHILPSWQPICCLQALGTTNQHEDFWDLLKCYVLATRMLFLCTFWGIMWMIWSLSSTNIWSECSVF